MVLYPSSANSRERVTARLADEDDVDARLVRKRRVALLGAADGPHEPQHLGAHRAAARLRDVRHVEEPRRVHPRAEPTRRAVRAEPVRLRRFAHERVHGRSARRGGEEERGELR